MELLLNILLATLICLAGYALGARRVTKMMEQTKEENARVLVETLMDLFEGKYDEEEDPDVIDCGYYDADGREVDFIPEDETYGSMALRQADEPTEMEEGLARILAAEMVKEKTNPN